MLFSWDLISEEISDISELSNKKFEELAKKYGIITNQEDFESRFNAEHFSTHTHQLRIVKE